MQLTNPLDEVFVPSFRWQHIMVGKLPYCTSMRNGTRCNGGPPGHVFHGSGGVVWLEGDLEGSILGEILKPFSSSDGEYPEGLNIAPLLGVEFVEPWEMATGSFKPVEATFPHSLYPVLNCQCPHCLPGRDEYFAEMSTGSNA